MTSTTPLALRTCVRFLIGIATPEREVGIASTKKERAAIRNVADRYILSVSVQGTGVDELRQRIFIRERPESARAMAILGTLSGCGQTLGSVRDVASPTAVSTMREPKFKLLYSPAARVGASSHPGGSRTDNQRYRNGTALWRTIIGLTVIHLTTMIDWQGHMSNHCDQKFECIRL